MAKELMGKMIPKIKCFVWDSIHGRGANNQIWGKVISTSVAGRAVSQPHILSR